MHIDLLFARFDDLLATPDDVAYLEAAILQLAVQGKLVPQDTEDEPASKLLERIRSEKERLIEAGELRNSDPLPIIKTEEIPYALPNGWAWARLGGIILWATGTGFPLKHQGHTDLPYLFCKVSDMNLPGNEKWVTEAQNTIDDDIAKKTKARIHPIGTIIFPKIGGAIATNKRRILARPAAIDNNCLGVTNLGACDTEWLYLLLRSMDFSQYQSGTSVPALGQGTLSRIVIALPPLAEQKRIVAKVDALLAQTRALAARLEQADAALLPAAQAAFQALSAAPDATAQRAAWQRVADHFDTLTNDPRALSALKQTILQLAVEGKLVPQNPEDEPASVLLERVEAEKERLVQSGDIKIKSTLPAGNGDIPYELPEGWKWIRAGELFQVQSGYAFKSRDFTESGIRLVRNINIGHDSIVWQDAACIPFEDREYYGDFELGEGDILVSLDRPIISTGLKLARVVKDDLPSLLVQRVGRINLFDSDMYSGYVFLWFKSSLFVDGIDPGRSKGVPHISPKDIERLLVPLPPLAEQQRIVATVEALLALCDALAAGVVQAEEVRGRVLGAVLNGGNTTDRGNGR